MSRPRKHSGLRDKIQPDQVPQYKQCFYKESVHNALRHICNRGIAGIDNLIHEEDGHCEILYAGTAGHQRGIRQSPNPLHVQRYTERPEGDGRLGGRICGCLMMEKKKMVIIYLVLPTFAVCFSLEFWTRRHRPHHMSQGRRM